MKIIGTGSKKRALRAKMTSPRTKNFGVTDYTSHGSFENQAGTFGSFSSVRKFAPKKITWNVFEKCVQSQYGKPSVNSLPLSETPY